MNLAASGENDQKEICIITGMSGSGKTTALRCLEDMQYFTVDGLPAGLAPQMAAMLHLPQMNHFKGIAIGMDIRQDNLPDNFPTLLSQLEELGFPVRLVFLDAGTDAIIRRYAATRRPHPLERQGMTLEAAISAERDMLAPLLSRADAIIDSSAFSIHDLRREMLKIMDRGTPGARNLKINFYSFGYKYGIPADADFVFDLRFLDNPYFVEELRPMSGMDREVAEYVFSSASAGLYRDKLKKFLNFVLPEMEKEGRYRVNIAFGCTGGRHRSVAMTEAMTAIFSAEGYQTHTRHINIDKEKP